MMDHAQPIFTLFRNDVEATFLRRPNRFRVEVALEEAKKRTADTARPEDAIGTEEAPTSTGDAGGTNSASL
jgi:hypothetical protein